MRVGNGYLLDDLEDGDRVLWVGRVKGGIRICEACDGYFEVDLTPERLERFIADLRAIAAQPEPEGGE